MTQADLFAASLPGNIILPERRHQLARIALGVRLHLPDDTTPAEWNQAREDADRLIWVHEQSQERARWRTCPPLSSEGDAG